MTSFLKHKRICLRSAKQCQLSLLISPGLPQTPLALLPHSLAKGKKHLKIFPLSYSYGLLNLSLRFTIHDANITALRPGGGGKLHCALLACPEQARSLVLPMLGVFPVTFTSLRSQGCAALAGYGGHKRRQGGLLQRWRATCRVANSQIMHGERLWCCPASPCLNPAPTHFNTCSEYSNDQNDSHSTKGIWCLSK